MTFKAFQVLYTANTIQTQLKKDIEKSRLSVVVLSYTHN
jgi:hypothetical protein